MFQEDANSDHIVAFDRRNKIFFLAFHFRTDLQKSRLQIVKSEYLDELEILKKEFDTERALIIEQHKQELNDLQDILFAMEQNTTERENDARQDFQSLRDEIKNKVINSCIMIFIKRSSTQNGFS